jgi:ornithine decarboxylase
VLADGVEPDRIIFAQPCKTKSYIRHAATQGVKQMTFDNLDELHKIKQIFPDAELYLRIMADDSQSIVQLSMKYGAALDSVPELLQLAKSLELNVVGVAFHVGSGATDPLAFHKAVRDARWVFDHAASLGFNFHTLDVGGGLVPESFEEKAGVLSAALDEFIPAHIRIIGEPGRYYVQNAFTIACHVIARRAVLDAATGRQNYMIYLNDGVYGNFSGMPFDHQNPIPRLLRVGNTLMYEIPTPANKGVEYSLWGPTCDGIDQISKSCWFEQTIDVGDWLYFDNHGAYNGCSATRFNGYSDTHDVVYVCSEVGASKLLGL